MSREGAIPTGVAEEVAAALGEPGPEAFERVERLGGGCIHPAVRVETRSGRSAFLKWSSSPGEAGFRIEAQGLRALAGTDALRVPEVLGVGMGSAAATGWLLLELIDEGPPTPATAGRLGSGLVQMHAPLDDQAPGWEEDGWIGSLPQQNRAPASEWPEFWRDFRLMAQWESASAHFDPEFRRRWERLMDRIPDGLRGWEEDGLSLLHGDLWSGNVLTDRRGEPVLIDPAVYRGHREVDLAMMELFGGFPQEAMDRYRREAPLASGYEELRRDIYQLHPLLTHVNLFGEGYAAGVRRRVRRLSERLSITPA